MLNFSAFNYEIEFYYYRKTMVTHHIFRWWLNCSVSRRFLRRWSNSVTANKMKLVLLPYRYYDTALLLITTLEVLAIKLKLKS